MIEQTEDSARDDSTIGADEVLYRRVTREQVKADRANSNAFQDSTREQTTPCSIAIGSKLAEHGMTPVDLLLIEGFKRYPHDKLEVHRKATGKPLLYAGDPNIVAIATDVALTARAPDGRLLPVFDLNDVPAVADFVVEHCALRVAAA